MESRSALPSLHGKLQDQPIALKAEVPVSRPTSSVAIGGRRALGILPKSAGAASVSRRARHSDGAVASPWQSYESQAQPTVASDRMVVRVFTSTMRQAGKVEHGIHFGRSQQQGEYCKGPEDGDSRDEIQLLLDENATFRHENDVLRTKLVEKMRGQSKVVAGGQFRAASASMPAKAPATQTLACTKCATARARAIKCHQESEEAQAATTELRQYVDKIEAIQQRLWEERSTHVSEVMKLRDKLAQKVEECVLIQAECTKLENQVKTLQPETDFEEIFTPQVEEKEVADEATQCTLQQSCDKAAQLREIAALKDEIQLLVRQVCIREQELKAAMFKNLQEAQKKAKGDEEKRERVSQSRLDEDAKSKRRISELEQTLKEMHRTMQDRKQTHQKELRLLQEDHTELRKEVVAKESAAQVQKQHHRDEISAREQQHQTLVKALQVRLHAVAVDHTAEKTKLTNQITELERKTQTLEKENAQLIANQTLQQQKVEEVARAERELVRKEGVAEQEKRALQARVTEVEAELADQLSLMQKQKRSHARALERSLESSLRLCVVAPTVNVQLNTKTRELVSVMCRSTPQQASLKRVIESDVLPLFTSVYLQGADDSSPQANVPMTRWLQELLHDMQARIAAQLESIYSSASMNGSE